MGRRAASRAAGNRLTYGKVCGSAEARERLLRALEERDFVFEVERLEGKGVRVEDEEADLFGRAKRSPGAPA